RSRSRSGWPSCSTRSGGRWPAEAAAALAGRGPGNRLSPDSPESHKAGRGTTMFSARFETYAQAVVACAAAAYLLVGVVVAARGWLARLGLAQRGGLLLFLLEALLWPAVPWVGKD